MCVCVCVCEMLANRSVSLLHQKTEESAEAGTSPVCVCVRMRACVHVCVRACERACVCEVLAKSVSLLHQKTKPGTKDCVSIPSQHVCSHKSGNCHIFQHCLTIISGDSGSSTCSTGHSGVEGNCLSG